MAMKQAQEYSYGKRRLEQVVKGAKGQDLTALLLNALSPKGLPGSTNASAQSSPAVSAVGSQGFLPSGMQSRGATDGRAAEDGASTHQLGALHLQE